MTRKPLSAIIRALDNERSKLGSFEDLISSMIDSADAQRKSNPFYALLAYVEPITKRLAENVEKLEAIDKQTIPAIDPATSSAAEQSDTYQKIRDDLDSLMGDFESAAGLACFIVMEGVDYGEGAVAPGQDFVKALHSLQTLLEHPKSDGDAMVRRMMALEHRP